MRFFMIDKINVWQLGVKAEAVKNISLSEDFFDDHFPRRPIMPGVLIIEGMAQLSGILLEASVKEKHNENVKCLLTILERTKFREIARPGDTLNYQAEIISINKNGGKVTATASCDGRTIVTTGMVFAFKYVDDPMLESKRLELLKTWMPESIKADNQ
jgi:3-hydroxymyristoyl/3-hydroxydecanoyl-(acyl carrier protein) dehydratase